MNLENIFIWGFTGLTVASLLLWRNRSLVKQLDRKNEIIACQAQTIRNLLEIEISKPNILEAEILE